MKRLQDFDLLSDTEREWIWKSLHLDKAELERLQRESSEAFKTDAADALRAIEEWSGAEMWRRKSGPSTSKGDMRVQAMVINDRARSALGLRRRPRRDWLQDKEGAA